MVRSRIMTEGLDGNKHLRRKNFLVMWQKSIQN